DFHVTGVQTCALPIWFLFRDGCPGGESLADISARGQRVAGRLKSLTGNVLVFGHGHMLRVVAAHWLGLTADHARCFHLGTTGLSSEERRARRERDSTQ